MDVYVRYWCYWERTCFSYEPGKATAANVGVAVQDGEMKPLFVQQCLISREFPHQQRFFLRGKAPFGGGGGDACGREIRWTHGESVKSNMR